MGGLREMTNEEAVDIFEGIDELDGISMFYQPGGKAGKLTIYGCGRPLTEEAWAEMEMRIGADQDGRCRR